MARNNVQPLRSMEDINKMKQSLLQYCSYRDYVLFTLGISVGLRVSDLLKLRVKDVRYKSSIKTNETGIFILTSNVQELVNQYSEFMEDDDWLFPSRKGDDAITSVQAYRVLAKAALMAGIEDVGTHSMRKTFGYHYYKETDDIITLMKIFKHPASNVTKQYIGIE